MTLSRLLVLALMVSITVPSFAQDPISVADARKQEFGSVVVKVAGRVTAAGQFRNIAYIEDGTAGIAVFNAAFRTSVQIGDSVVIDSASLTEFGQSTGAPGTGLTELTGSNLRFTVIPVPREDPRPRTTTIPLIGEGVEGSLIRIRNVTFVEKGAFQGESNYSVIDRQGNDIPVRIDGATNIATGSLPIPEDEIDLIGCVSQFRGSYQVLPRFAEDISLPPIEEDTVSTSRTLDITTWNLDWYGSTDTSRGPADKQRQRRSIRQVMDSVGADIYALQEVLTEEALKALSDSINGTYTSLYATNVTSPQKMAYIYNTETITPISSGLAVNGGSQAWASGRYPYRMTFDAMIDGATKRIVIFNIHAKATSDSTAMEDYDRRKTDAQTFHAYLKDFYSDTALIFVGDFNDNLSGSVVDSSLDTPWATFVDDTERWVSTTISLEERGLASYIGFNRSFLDHVFLTTDISGFHHRTYLEAPQAYLSSYSSTVSDHLPVTSRLFVDPSTSVDEFTPSAAPHIRVAPNPASDHASVEIIAEESMNIVVDIIDGLGNVTPVVSEHLTPQIRLVSLPVSSLTNGVYYVRVSAGKIVTATPIIVNR